jgi:hypothetical protein
VTKTGVRPHPPGAQQLFDELAAEHLGRPGVRLGRIFHNEGLQVHTKLYAFMSKDRLVVKVPAAQALSLTSTGKAEAFEPRPGRVMKEWVALDPPSSPGDRRRWRQLMADAHRYVAVISTPRSTPPIRTSLDRRRSHGPTDRSPTGPSRIRGGAGEPDARPAGRSDTL